MVSLALLTARCAGGASQTITPPRSDQGPSSTSTSAASSGGSRPTAVTAGNRCPAVTGGGMVLEGQLGTLRAAEVSATVNPTLPQLQACYARRLEEHPYLAGALQFKIRVGTDGAVRWVIPLQSSMGDRETEQCMLDVLGSVRFPEPCGGETETTWGPSFEGGEDARPAVPWTSTRIQAQVGRRRAALAQCLGGASGASAEVTLYVAPGGRVATAGAAVSSEAAARAIPCLLSEVSGWRGLPDPGSYPAKTSFRVP